MTTTQPKWTCIAQLGDATPLDNGGYWILRDETGVYPPEAEFLSIDDDGERTNYTVHRVVLECCTDVGGILSDNKFHPDYPAWFARDMASMASFIGQPEGELRAALCSTDPIERAHAYRAIGDYHGWDNLDSYPLQLTRTEARARYRKSQYRPR